MGELRLDRLTRRFPDGTVAVNAVSVTIRDGELFVLVGPSGCGKSTLLNMIAGLEAIDGGELRLDGRVINELDPRERNMAMVFQNYAIYPHMTVAQNLAFPLKLAKLPDAEIRRRIDHAAAILELIELLDRRPSALSGGQRQRVAMGRALVREPAVFLLDEPLSNLDAKLRGRMRVEIAALQQRLGVTMLYVTHDQTEALTLGDRVAVLNKGTVQQVGTPRDLYAKPVNLFVAGFLGSPPMNFVEVVIVGDHLALRMTGAGAGEPADLQNHGSRAVVAGLRPEQLSVVTDSAAEPSPADLVFEADVQIAEWHGSDTYAYVRPVREPVRETVSAEATGSAAGRLIAVRLSPDSSVREGDRIRLKIDRSAIHLFDPESGLRIGDSAA